METLLQQSDKLIAVFLLITMSISLRIVLQFFGQRWITTTAHTTTLVLLPLLTYVITRVISGNIALSLGMVGALSIVRFRHPVRSPLELSVYFGAITMGIAASVNLLWLIFLGGSILFAVIVLLATHYFTNLVLKKSFFNASFSEGNSLSTLELTLSDELDLLDQSELLKVKKKHDHGTQYTLASTNFSELNNLLSSLKGHELVKSYQLNR